MFRLLRSRPVPVLVLENVRNMLMLDGGEAMRFLVDELEALGFRWAYRLVDSRFVGVPQRRQRVILVAALELDPRAVLFSDDAGEPPVERTATTSSASIGPRVCGASGGRATPSRLSRVGRRSGSPRRRRSGDQRGSRAVGS